MPGVIPYLIRAYCDWIEDNSFTPYVLVNAKCAGVSAPDGFDNHGKIVLNISSSAAIDRLITNDSISFKARFQGKSQKLLFPVKPSCLFMPKRMAKGCFLIAKILALKKKTKNQTLRY